MAESPTVSFRVPPEAEQQLRRLMAAQDRERSDMARRVFLAGLATYEEARTGDIAASEGPGRPDLRD